MDTPSNGCPLDWRIVPVIVASAYGAGEVDWILPLQVKAGTPAVTATSMAYHHKPLAAAGDAASL